MQRRKNYCKITFNFKKKFKNLLTIIIPRHTQRINKIDEEIATLNLKTIKNFE